MIFSIIAIVFTIVFFNFNNLKCYAADSKVISGIFVNGVWVDRTDSTGSGNTFPPLKKWTVCRWTPSNTPAPVGDWAYAGSLDESEHPLFPNGTFNNDYLDLYKLQIPYDDGTYKGILIRMSNPGTDYYNFVTPLTPRDGSMQITWSYMNTWYYEGTVSTIDVPGDPTHTPTIKPTVTLNAPSTVLVGDTAYLSATGNSTEPTVNSIKTIITLSGSGINGDNPITAQEDGKSVTATGNDWFSNTGIITVTAVAIDSNNVQSDPVTKQIQVVNPSPTVNLIQSGILKENRKVTIDASTSYSGSMRATINWSTAKWIITPLNGASINDVRIQSHTQGSTDGAVMYDPSKGINNPLDGLECFDIQFKKAGQYKIQCTLNNSYGMSGTSTIQFTIVIDDPPIANFSVPTKIYRDPTNLNYADITSNDSSSVIDNDIIAQRVWCYAFDSNNDGNYDDETWYVNINSVWQPYGDYTAIKALANNIPSVNSGNLTNIKVSTTHVGKCKFELIIREDFGQEYIPQFVTDYDKKVANTFDH